MGTNLRVGIFYIPIYEGSKNLLIDMTDLLLVAGQSLLVYLLIIICLRLLGKKGLSELSVADLVLIIIIGESMGHLIPEVYNFAVPN